MATLGVYGPPRSVGRARSLGVGVSELYYKPDPKAAKEAGELGVRYVPVVWVPEARGPGEGVVDAWGSRGLFAFKNSGCISNPAVIGRAEEAVERVAVKLESDAVILDALRFPSPSDGRLLYSCFCPHCSRAMREAGADPGRLRESLRRLAGALHRYPYLDPGLLEALAEWVAVRQRIVLAALQRLRDRARSYGLKVWAAVFPQASPGWWARTSPRWRAS